MRAAVYGKSDPDVPANVRKLMGLAPTRFQEFLVDSIKHADDGSLDDELEDLTLDSFGTGKQCILTPFLEGQMTAFEFARFYNIIATVLDPEATAVTDMREIYCDREKTEVFTQHVGRLLHCIGKKRDNECSLGAIVKYWQPVVATASRAGAGPKADAI